MNLLQVTGGNSLRGEVAVPGSKNAALAILSSVALAHGQTTLTNVPDVSDVHIKLRLLEQFGIQYAWHEGALFLDTENLEGWDADEERVRPIRTSFYLLGPLLTRLRRIKLPTPGGCNIGLRPVDLHLKGLRQMGARIELESGAYVAEVDRFQGAEIYLDVQSAGATQHLMATATLAEGITEIQNASIEPEVVTLAEYLNRLGARIEGAGTTTITIMGVQRLEGCEFRVPADRLQAGTFLLAGAMTRGSVVTHGIIPEHQAAVASKLREAGADVEEGPDWVRVSAQRRLDAMRIKTMPYPGFPTDMQQPMAALLCLAQGQSQVEETIYENRTGHVDQLELMGAKLQQKGNLTLIEGVDRLRGANVKASDLRAGAALVLAGLVADGVTTISNVHFIDRGYERLESIVNDLGGSIARVHAEVDESAPTKERA
ncbi:MAG TPA: UDP-N-acetylglucosamine 1-carboxyvinyltransferase [Fimbriimonadaceae bacterium]|nr:UDP-N-acetylglucosamine 1-carboxyvinyltransferase [Fimbriimonadaceae bacterium]HRJ32834.1 UDP-N-acetylglucosamine 1-carboxyvinyltransferase [Fimbriimonadaceae bacterium]